MKKYRIDYAEIQEFGSPKHMTEIHTFDDDYEGEITMATVLAQFYEKHPAETLESISVMVEKGDKV